jgi:hypothetical protein
LLFYFISGIVLISNIKHAKLSFLFQLPPQVAMWAKCVHDVFLEFLQINLIGLFLSKSFSIGYTELKHVFIYALGFLVEEK